MEDGRRKKKNKKNKGKAAKTVDNVAVGSGESMQCEPEVNHESAPQQNHQETDTGNASAQDTGEPTKTVDNVTLSLEEPMQTGSEVNHVNHKSAPEQIHEESDTGTVGTQNASAMDLEAELESHKVKESNFVDLQKTIKDLQNNIISCIEKEASLEKKIELLQNENEFFVKKEISWNLKLEQLQSELHSCSIKEASLENKLNSMESENDSRTHKENLISEMVAKLEEANTGLQLRVKELERSRDNLVQENQQLTNSISLLEGRAQLLESEAASFRSSMRMMTEVNQQDGIAEHSATFFVPSTEADANALPVTHLLPHEEIISESTDKFASAGTFFETISINGIADAGVHPKELPLLDEFNGGAEIVQIPLEDNQIQQVDAEDIKNEERKAVPLSHGPLIGAPFRFVSFVAKYVSGADLVKENRPNSG